jgi:vanillate O-demethylase ferredoxin subunit
MTRKVVILPEAPLMFDALAGSWRELRVAARRLETPEIVTLVLTDPAGAELPAFSAGAHIDIEAAPGVVRQYSLLNDPAERHRYVVGILLDPASRGGSAALHRVPAGALVRIGGPRNHFELAEGAHETLLLAGGIGITPLLCMAGQLHTEGRKFALHYCTRAARSTAFLTELRQAPFAEHVHLHFDDAGDAQRLRLPEVLAGLAPDAHVYVCGPGGFMGWCIEAASEAGISDARIHREFFKGQLPVAEAGDAVFCVQLASTGAVFAVAPEQTILQVLRGNGVSMPASCETGVCGTCLTGVLSGTPDHRDCYLTKAEQAAGDVILPCCSRAASALLVLDI